MSEPGKQPLTGEVYDAGGVKIYGWEWNDIGGPRGRSRLPWFGIFLVVFGALLLLRQVFPALETAGSLLFLAVGVAFLVSWLVNRGLGSLYLGVDHHGARRPRPARRRGRRLRAGRRHPVPRRRVPVHRARARRERRGLGLAARARAHPVRDRGLERRHAQPERHRVAARRSLIVGVIVLARAMSPTRR